MADDIDIEEHDVLESLRRRRAPDGDAGAAGAAVVKSEPVEIDYEESNYEDAGNFEYQWEWDKDHAPEIKVEPQTEEEFRFGKIILGSKPAEPQHQEATGGQDGQEHYNYNMSLVLDDWGPMLERSECYCSACQILFATVNALDAHKMIAHSFLVATDKQPSPERNKAIKSTAKPSNNDDNQTCQICQYSFKGNKGTAKSNLVRHYRQVHQVDPKNLDSTKDFKSWRICNHCNMYFPDDTSLVKHLYELLPISNKSPTKDDKKAVAPISVRAKPALNIDKSNSKFNRAVKSTAAVVKNVSSNDKDTKPLPNRIILGSKPVTVKSESITTEYKSNRWTCEVCSIVYSKKYYLQHMKRFHPDYLLKKLSKQPDKHQPEKIILNNTHKRYKCDVCNEILTSYNAVRKHRLKHPLKKGTKIITRIVKLNKIHKVKVKTVVKKEPVKVYAPKLVAKVKEPMEDKGILVSKSTLFKCNTCSVHFLTCTGACQHSMVCETSSNIRDWACPKCQRVFKSAEKRAHEFQHQVMNANKFKVYVVYLEMIVRILCECPDCYICFEEDKFAGHISGGCHDAASYYCSECRLPIDIHSKANHDSKHKKGDFNKDDFIKIDYVCSKQEKTPKKIRKEFVEESSPVKKVKIEIDEPRKGLKRKLDISVPNQRKRSRLLDELHLYYCPSCKSYLGNKLSFHLSGKCKEVVVKTRRLCKICGIYFRSKYYKSHMGLHEKNPNLTLSDFTFTRMTDSKKIKPVPELHNCKRCKVNFMTKAARISHKCGRNPSTNCQVCQKKIQKDVFKIHMQIHNYVIPSEVKSINEVTPKMTPISPARSRKETQSPMTQKLTRKEATLKTKLPDLLMKYQSLTALWNILYLCATCDTFTDSYDKVVQHCQNHLTNMENYGVVIKKCQICDMKFDSECYKQHLELHAGSKVINKKTFQILKYDYCNLFSNQWFDFIDLPDEQKSQIVCRSIYGASRCVKMRLLLQGPPEYTLYRCSKCMNCVATDTIIYHVKLANCLKANKIACSICDMTFTIRSQCDEHEKIHESTGLGLESFRIVAFNDADDAENNLKIMSCDTENRGSKISFTSTDEEASKTTDTELGQNNANGKSFVIYKCAECHSSILHMRNFAKHACNKNNPKKECEKCGLLFSAKHLSSHLRLHKNYAFSRQNVITKTLNRDGKVINIKKQSQEKSAASTPYTLNDTQKSNLYKCFCGLHYTSLKTFEKHYKLKNCGTVIREKCSQCNLLFDPIEVVNHLCKHHAQKHVKSFNIITANKKTLYKCSLCHVLFYNKTAAMPHKAKCAGKFCGKKCEKCGLAFDATSLDTHLIDHKRNSKLRTDCYVIVKIPDETTHDYPVTKKKSDKGLSPNVLYRCKCCDIHFLRRTSARNHMVKRGRCNLTATQICVLCKLKFPVKSIPKHVGWQHNTMKVKQFKVIDLIMGVNTKIPKDGREAVMEKYKVAKQMAKPVIPKAEPVNVTVFRCMKCMVHFTDENGLVNHLEDRCSKELTEECDDCAVKFASRNIKEHIKHHGPGTTLIMDIIEDVELPPIRHDKTKKYRAYEPKTKEFSLDRYDNKLYRCTECDFHYNTHSTLVKHRDFCNPRVEGLKCEACDIGWFTKYSLRRHRQIHEKYNFTKDDFVVLTLADGDVSRVESNPGEDTKQEIEDTEVSLDSSFELPTVSSGKTKEQKKETNIHNLYKCADCNVYFGTQKTCHKHIAKHSPLDPKEYIECKLCGFQFTIMGLQPHIKKHHEKPFNLEEVLVEEYQPDDIKANETYYASEKDQSRLVSTSDDVKNVPNLEEENCEVTSCNEMAEKVDSTDGQVTNVMDKTKVSYQANDLKETEPSAADSVLTSDGTVNGQDD